jgi:hypothetical protein
VLNDAGDADRTICRFYLEANHIFEVAEQRFRGRDVPKFQVEQLSKFIARPPIELEIHLLCNPIPLS